MSQALRTPSRRRGFGLVETVAALAIVGVLASLALPSYRDAQLRARRVDATQTLQRLQLAQEQFRIQRGRYADRLSLLPGTDNTQSALGRYRVALRTDPLVDGYELVAQAQGPQADDKDCRTVTLRVTGSFTFQEPGAPCWPS
jgi:type IV pilus assembly protein PilE